MNFRSILMAAAMLSAASAVDAQLSIEITGAGANRIPVAIADFGGDRTTGQALAAIVRADLERSGLFQLVDGAGLPSGEAGLPPYADWKSRGADALAGGSVTASGARFETRFRLFDTQKQVQLGGQAYGHQASQVRLIGHRVADYIYEKLTGERGVFSTRIAYVVKVGSRYELQIADADGGNAQTALASREPIISPSWSPDGSKLAYVSFEAKKPVIYVHDLTSGRRHVAANFKGSNSAPAWSPDGRKLAIVLTRRQPADLPHRRQRRQRPAHHLRGAVQRDAPAFPRRQEPGLHLPAKRQLPADRHGPGHPPDPDPDRLGQGRIPQLCTQQSYDSVCHRNWWPWRPGGGLRRRPRKTKAFRPGRRRA